ncbi:hypothetical protein ACFCV8_13075 [Streptomyces sp. NPDC056347]|uniref:hypothetical protein n=1 Tax=Streptomyces sp. NPDC056347 TaxID=3345790 RepID=UPI0035E2118E
MAAQFVVAVGATLGPGFAHDPVTAFTQPATVIVTVIIGVYIIVNPSCVGYFLRRCRDAFDPVLHLLFPVLGIAAFLPSLLTAAGIPVLDFVSELSAPVSYAGPVVGVRMLTGIVVLVVLMRRHPERVAETGRIHLDDPAPAGDTATGAEQR